MIDLDLNLLAADVHKANAKWWIDLETGRALTRNSGELLMLVITELSEAVEGIRKNLMDDKIPTRLMEEVEMADAFIRLLDYSGGFGIRISREINNDMFGLHFWDAIQRQNKGEQILCITSAVFNLYLTNEEYELSAVIGMIAAYCQNHGLDLIGAYHEKMAFNAVRHDHTVEARKLANGKKF